MKRFLLVLRMLNLVIVLVRLYRFLSAHARAHAASAAVTSAPASAAPSRSFSPPEDSVQWASGTLPSSGKFLIVTLDYGVNWYNVEQAGSEFRILGPVDSEMQRQVLGHAPDLRLPRGY